MGTICKCGSDTVKVNEIEELVFEAKCPKCGFRVVPYSSGTDAAAAFIAKSKATESHTLSVLRKLKRQASKYVGLASSRTAGYISDATLNEIIDEAIRNEGGEV